MPTSILYENYLTSGSMLSATSLAPARLSGVTTNVSGSAIMQVQGVYTGQLDTNYAVQVQAVNATGDFGAGTLIRWSDDGGVNWDVENIVPAENTWVTMNNGVQFRFIRGSTNPQFVVADNRNFRAVREFSVARLIDWTRDREWRSDTLTPGQVVDLVADLGSSQAPGACAMMDHNLVLGSNVSLQASSVSNFATLLYDVVQSYQPQKILTFPLNPPFARYWRLRFTAALGQADIRMALWYLGTRLAFSKEFRIGFASEDGPLDQSLDANVLMKGQGLAALEPEQLDVEFGYRANSGDVESFRQLRLAVNDWAGSGQRRPFFFVPQDLDTSAFDLYHWAGPFRRQHRYHDLYDVPMRLLQVVRSVA
jgi:hypothetical protein